jgi:tRNA (guanosine-2'-O-)-methyltransferase
MLRYQMPLKEMKDQAFGHFTKTLSPFMKEERLQRYKHILSLRSRRVICLFDHTHHGHNISAILRSLEAFGFMDALFLYRDGYKSFKQSESIERGSSQWLILNHLSTFESCLTYLKEQNYEIALVSLPHFSKTSNVYNTNVEAFHVKDLLLSDRFEKRMEDKGLCLVFGSELTGIQPSFHDFASFYLYIDMKGFVESLNVSVCAGILLNALRLAFEKNTPRDFYLTNEEQILLLDYWVAKTLDNSEKIIKLHYPSFHPYYQYLVSKQFSNFHHFKT